MKRRILAVAFLLTIAAASGSAVVQQQPKAGKKGIIVRVAKPYDKLRSAIRALGGDITYEFENVDALAANVPADKVAALAAMAEAGALYKDVLVHPAKGVTVVKLGRRPAAILTGDDVAQISGIEAHKDGNRGQGIYVAVVDSGVANAPQVAALSGSVVGGETFVPTDPLSATSTGNDAHGTQVASMIAAHAGFIFPNDDPLVQSLLVHDPSSVVKCPNKRFPACGQGQSVVPMVGTAPDARLYALKVFDAAGGSGTKSRIMAAMDRVITLRRNFNRGLPVVPVNMPCGDENKPCRFNSLPIQVVNLSVGGANLFAGRDVEDELTEKLLDVGVTPVVGAGNDGFAAMTGNGPGTGMGSVTVGAENIAAKERVEQDLFQGLGLGIFHRPTKHAQTAWFSSRGPTADGRIDPDLIASGVGNYTQAADGSITFVEGTSFSTPVVSGAAAAIASALRAGSYTATELRNALIESANPGALGDGSGPIDQGNGILDIDAALRRLRSGRAGSTLPDSRASDSVIENIRPLGFKPVEFQDNVFSTRLKNLRPGEVAQFFVATKDEVNRLTVRLRNINPELPPNKQNQLYGDDLFVRVADAPTSFFSARVDEFVADDSKFVIDEPQTGLVRVAVQGDWTNAGRISADLVIERRQRALLPETADGKIVEHQTIEVPVKIPSGKKSAVFELFWDNDWSAYPTNDIDMVICAPGLTGDACDFSGATLDSPERVVIDKPAAGVWKIQVIGFDLNTRNDKFKLRVSADGERLQAR